MTKEEINAAAKEAGLQTYITRDCHPTALERFAAIMFEKGRLAEREQANKDAKRYRWLRAEHERIDPIAAVVWKRNLDRKEHNWVNTADLDTGIEQAIGEGK